jgi:hypothetical protein
MIYPKQHVVHTPFGMQERWFLCMGPSFQESILHFSNRSSPVKVLTNAACESSQSTRLPFSAFAGSNLSRSLTLQSLCSGIHFLNDILNSVENTPSPPVIIYWRHFPGHSAFIILTTLSFLLVVIPRLMPWNYRSAGLTTTTSNDKRNEYLLFYHRTAFSLIAGKRERRLVQSSFN